MKVYFKASLVQFTSLCMCLWSLERFHLCLPQVECRIPLALAAVTTCCRSSPSSIINDESLGIRQRACAYPCPHIKPYCHFPKHSFCSGYNSSCCRAFLFPPASADTNIAANLKYCPHPLTIIPIYTNPPVKGSHAASYNFTANSVFKSLFFHYSGQN